MAVTLILTGKTPNQTQFGLDRFTERYKCEATADDVLTDPDVPQMGTAHPSYPFMFVTNRYCTETSESASALDLVYTGCLTGEGTPTLPAQQSSDGDQVSSASSSKNSLGGVLTSPFSVQFYGPTRTLKWITFGAPGVKGTVGDPTGFISVITAVWGDTSFSPDSSGILELIAIYFTEQISDTIQSNEIVAGQFWENTEQKLKSLVPYIFNIVPGFYPLIFNSGVGYVAGDSITIAGTGSCTMTVTSVFVNGSIFGLSITANTLSAATGTPIPATGGSGSGASFTVFEVT